MGRRTLGAGAVVIGVALAMACGSDRQGFQEGTPPPGGLGDGGPSFGQDASGACRCSADLHAVLDCDGNVVKTCPPDQGCAPGGGCVPACDSARANKSTVGCEYWSVDPGTDGEANGSCFAAYIANTWTTPVKLTVEYDGRQLDMAQLARIPSGQGSSITYTPLPNGELPPRQLAILFLADFPGASPPLPTRCPAGVTAGFTSAEASSDLTAMLKAFYIKSSAPVVAYDIFPYGGAQSYISSATLLVPTSAWDTNYLAVDAYAKSSIAGPTAQPFIEITANENDTQVTIRPTVAIAGGNGVAAAPANQPHTYTLQRGQVLQLKQDTELNGSPIQSNKPVGVWGGNSCMNIDVSESACDSGHQQLFPIKALGREYVGARHRNRVATREESPPWRIMGVVDGTALTWEPSAPAGAPTSLSSGQIVKFNAPGPFVVRSQDDQHPFYLGGHMTGQTSQGTDFGTGDPDWVNVVPPAQYLASYVFMTDPTMSNTSLTVVRKKAKDGTFKDVTLDCGSISGWKSAGSGGYEMATVDLVLSGNPVGSCGNGRHEMKSDVPFGLTVWGWDTTVSYAYPAGASVLPINQVVVPPTPR
jgi:hypothetical protein